MSIFDLFGQYAMMVLLRWNDFLELINVFVDVCLCVTVFVCDCVSVCVCVCVCVFVFWTVAGSNYCQDSDWKKVNAEESYKYLCTS